jgi:hypothetical protein
VVQRAGVERPLLQEAWPQLGVAFPRWAQWEIPAQPSGVHLLPRVCTLSFCLLLRKGQGPLLSSRAVPWPSLALGG